MEYKDYIQTVLDERTLWEQLAEESSELTKAALKVIRASGYSNNSTPIKNVEAYMNVIEELQDLLCVCQFLGLDNIKPNDAKLERWAKRIAGKADAPQGEVTAIQLRANVYRCSRCGSYFGGYGKDFSKIPSYCPNCGRYICYISNTAYSELFKEEE